jgi:hypothetical protein
MADSELGLTAELLAKVFPFHFAISRDGAVLQSGAALRRLVPSLLDGAPAAESLLIREPKIPFSFGAIRERTASAFTVEIVSSGLRMRGEMIEPPDTEALLFLGSPGSRKSRNWRSMDSDFPTLPCMIPWPIIYRFFTRKPRSSAITGP